MGISTTETPGPHRPAASSARRGGATIVTGSNRAMASAMAV